MGFYLINHPAIKGYPHDFGNPINQYEPYINHVLTIYLWKAPKSPHPFLPRHVRQLVAGSEVEAQLAQALRQSCSQVDQVLPKIKAQKGIFCGDNLDGIWGYTMAYFWRVYHGDMKWRYKRWYIMGTHTHYVSPLYGHIMGIEQLDDYRIEWGYGEYEHQIGLGPKRRQPQ